MGGGEARCKGREGERYSLYWGIGVRRKSLEGGPLGWAVWEMHLAGWTVRGLSPESVNSGFPCGLQGSCPF